MQASTFVCVPSPTAILSASGGSLLGCFYEAGELFALTRPNWVALFKAPAFNSPRT